MGGEVNKTDFTDEEFKAFSDVLNDQLDILKAVMEKPGFGSDPLMMGGELEFYLVDEESVASPRARELLDALMDDQYQHELNRYNVELNLSAFELEGKPFSAMLGELREKTKKLIATADTLGIKIVPVGILPTLKTEHLGPEYMTPEIRYKAINKKLLQIRGSSFDININGEESVQLTSDAVTVEGANTSFQVHMMVEHDRFADVFNAAQLTLPLALAVSANSSILLGNRVWDEARVALFKQSLDVRQRGTVNWRQPARVSFGRGWVRDSAWELYAETVALYEPILPMVYDEDAPKVWGEGKLPKLSELGLHLGTTWPWHRPVYCHQGSGHVRIEFRAIPAGPTTIDMVANAAFSIGLAVGLADEIWEYIPTMPFNYGEYNFYRAAQSGLDAKILWPFSNIHHPEEVAITEVLEKMIPKAAYGLRKLGVAESEIERYLSIIEKRLETGVTGARWQRRTHRFFEEKYDKETASKMLVDLYIQNARSAAPVAEWETPWT